MNMTEFYVDIFLLIEDLEESINWNSTDATSSYSFTQEDIKEIKAKLKLLIRGEIK